MLNLHRLLSLLLRPFRRRSKSPTTAPQLPNSPPSPSIRIATFNAAIFSTKTLNPPKSILKRHQTARDSNRRVSVTLNPQIPAVESRSRVLDVLRSVHADLFAVQSVRAEQGEAMNPLADLAGELGMKFVFAESWAPDFGNAVLSRWPIKGCRVEKIGGDDDFRNVLKVTIEVPGVGEVNLHCTQLDHLDEDWRLKQVGEVLGSSEEPHVLTGGLNALDETDYSVERWNEIVKYNEENGKPRPRADVMRLLKEKGYLDAKGFAGESEAVVVVAKGQDVQGTCKHGTRVDYILSSPGSPYKFLPGSYAVMSSKGTSDHHIVKVDIVKDTEIEHNDRMQKPKQRLVKIERGSTTGIWKLNS